MSDIQELRDIIRHLHGVESKHVQSVPVKKSFQENTVWDGTVFELQGHPTADKVYAWTHDTDDPKKRRHVTILHIHPVTSPEAAVKAAIIQEYRSRGTEAN
ncbi:MAG: hypothetical protein LAP21_20575 [Acidobacteriia bacterium]|nr:hypothetical protein [Terriglobia bacterium]